MLLHSCCAPCSGAMVEAMVDAGHDVTIFFYNPNIHPRKVWRVTAHMPRASVYMRPRSHVKRAEILPSRSTRVWLLVTGIRDPKGGEQTVRRQAGY